MTVHICFSCPVVVCGQTGFTRFLFLSMIQKFSKLVHQKQNEKHNRPSLRPVDCISAWCLPNSLLKLSSFPNGSSLLLFFSTISTLHFLNPGSVRGRIVKTDLVGRRGPQCQLPSWGYHFSPPHRWAGTCSQTPVPLSYCHPHSEASSVSSHSLAVIEGADKCFCLLSVIITFLFLH